MISIEVGAVENQDVVDGWPRLEGGTLQSSPSKGLVHDKAGEYIMQKSIMVGGGGGGRGGWGKNETGATGKGENCI